MHLALASCAPKMRLQSATPSSGDALAAVAPKARLKESRAKAPLNLVARRSQPLLGQRVVCWYTPFFMLVETCAELIVDSSHTSHNSHTNHSKILHTDSSQDSLAVVMLLCNLQGERSGPSQEATPEDTKEEMEDAVEEQHVQQKKDPETAPWAS